MDAAGDVVVAAAPAPGGGAEPGQPGPRALAWATIIGAMIVVWPYSKWVAVVQVPYLVWVSIATVLQLSITWMNWKP